MRCFEAEDWMDKVPGVAWVVATGAVAGVVAAVGVAPARKAEADHHFVEKQLLALHLPATNPGSATATFLIIKRKIELQ